MADKTFQWGDATVGVRELSIADEDEITALMLRLGSDSDNASGKYGWAEFNVAAEVTGELPFALVTRHDSAKDIQAAWAAWRAMPRRFVQRWRGILNSGDDADPK